MDKINQPKVFLERTQDYKLKMTKVSEHTDAEVPNNIPVGDIRIGYTGVDNILPRIGKSYYVRDVIKKNNEDVKG